MEEKLTEKRLRVIIDVKVIDMTEMLNGVFFTFFSIFNPADKIKNTTQI